MTSLLLSQGDAARYNLLALNLKRSFKVARDQFRLSGTENISVLLQVIHNMEERSGLTQKDLNHYCFSSNDTRMYHDMIHAWSGTHVQ